MAYNLSMITIEAGTFDDFTQVEMLSIVASSIENLSSQCFRGLANLRSLQMIENNLKWIGLDAMQSLPKLNALKISDDESLLIANHQFGKNQIVDSISLDIYSIEIDLIEHLFNHVRNLSINLALKSDSHGCEQTKFNGYEKQWIIEFLRLDNFRCGFMMEYVGTIKSLQLSRMIKAPYYDADEFKLKNLENLHTLCLNHNDFRELSHDAFDGAFKSLEILDLSHNKLTTIDMLIFDKFPKLKHLNITHNSITHLLNMNKIEINFQIHVDSNSFECVWLAYMTPYTKSFVYTTTTQSLNANGLECSLHRVSTPSKLSLSSCENEKMMTRLQLNALRNENFIVKPRNFAFIICGTILLGIAITYISIYTYNRSRLLKHQPFYHMLRDSLIRPISDARSTLARDFKGIIFRNLPPTNYEHPISDTNLTEMTEVVPVMEETNIYEEIPHERYERS